MILNAINACQALKNMPFLKVLESSSKSIVAYQFDEYCTCVDVMTIEQTAIFLRQVIEKRIDFIPSDRSDAKCEENSIECGNTCTSDKS